YARLVSRLEHAGLTRVHDFFERSQHHYLVMDYIDGVTLADYLLTESGLAEEMVLQWARELCDVLEYLHSHSIIFRDLKPSNIMLDRTRRIRLIDFGIAKEVDATMPGTRTFIKGAGTPGYAAPEQYAGGTDVRTDVYALGATLYTMVTRSAPPQSIEMMVGSARLTPVKVANPAVSDLLASRIERMMMLERSMRPQNMAEVQVLFGFREGTLRPLPIPTPFTMPLQPADPDDVTMVLPGASSLLPTQPASPPVHAPPAAPRSAAAALAVVATVVVLLALLFAGFARRDGTLDVTASAPGATVEVDGQACGTVPQTLQIPPGLHIVRLVKNGNLLASQQVSLPAGERKAVDFSLSGSHLAVTSDPSGATVLVDGTPLVGDRVSPGAHTLQVEMDGFEAQSRNVTVGVNQTVAWDVKLQPLGAGLSVEGPAGATVYVDGVSSGVIPLHLCPVAPGNHALWMEADGRRSSGITVQVPAGLNQDMTVTLTFDR
ncbi:MAG: protein kinase domain-containing protein, partial [Candidatus Xenobia bacterium]